MEEGEEERGDNKTDFDRSLNFMACHKFILKRIALKCFFYRHFKGSFFCSDSSRVCVCVKLVLWQFL